MRADHAMSLMRAGAQPYLGPRPAGPGDTMVDGASRVPHRTLLPWSSSYGPAKATLRTSWGGTPALGPISKPMIQPHQRSNHSVTNRPGASAADAFHLPVRGCSRPPPPSHGADLRLTPPRAFDTPERPKKRGIPKARAVVTGLVTKRRDVGARGNPPPRAGPYLADPSLQARRGKDVFSQTRTPRTSHREAGKCRFGVVR
jgi:hypothetical protein